MANMKVPVEGQVQFLKDGILGGTLENWELRVFATAHTPAVTDTLATYTAIEASFTGYAAIVLTRGSWTTPNSAGTTIDAVNGNGKTTYANQVFNCTSSQAVNGWFYKSVTSGKCMGAQAFASTINLVNPSTLTIPPVYELGAF